MKSSVQKKFNASKLFRAMKFIFVLSLFLISVANAEETDDDAKIVKVGLINVTEAEQKVRDLHHKYSIEYFNELSKYVAYDYKFETGTLEELQKNYNAVKSIFSDL